MTDGRGKRPQRNHITNPVPQVILQTQPASPTPHHAPRAVSCSHSLHTPAPASPYTPDYSALACLYPYLYMVRPSNRQKVIPRCLVLQANLDTDMDVGTWAAGSEPVAFVVAVVAGMGCSGPCWCFPMQLFHSLRRRLLWPLRRRRFRHVCPSQSRKRIECQFKFACEYGRKGHASCNVNRAYIFMIAK
jgi:hypothetical protein